VSYKVKGFEFVEELPIDETNGKESFIDSTAIIEGGMYIYWHKMSEDRPTEQATAYVYDVTDKMTYGRIFSSFGDKGKIALTEGQILSYVGKYPEKLRLKDGRLNLFLEKCDGRLYIVSACFDYYPDKRGLYIRKLPFRNVFDNPIHYKHRVIILA